MNNENPFLFAPSQGQPASPTIDSDVQITKAYPSVQYVGSEVNYQYVEEREIAGDLWVVNNASYASGQWAQVNPSLPSYALVLQSAGNLVRYFAPAVSLSPIPWAPTSNFDPLGALVKTPAPFTAPTEVSISDNPTWNAAGGQMTGWLLNVADLSSAPSSKLLDLQVNGASQFSVNKNGSVVYGGTASQVVNGTSSLAGGVSIKWGQVSAVPADGSSNAALVFATAFPVQCLQLWTSIDTGSAPSANQLTIQEFSVTNAGATVLVRGGVASTTCTVRYGAIGY